MTEAFIRIERDGKWQNIEFDQLRDNELINLSKKMPDDGWKWAIFLAKFIRDNIRESEVKE